MKLHKQRVDTPLPPKRKRGRESKERKAPQPKRPKGKKEKAKRKGTVSLSPFFHFLGGGVNSRFCSTSRQ